MLEQIKKLLIVCFVLMFSGCATIVNDAYVPIAFSFSDGSEGSCTVTNKRINETIAIPGKHMIRRSDDDLKLTCKTADGRTGSGSAHSGAETGKFLASVIVWDFGITDAITDKHRTYPSEVVIPVKPKD